MAPIKERIQRFGGPSTSGYTYIPVVVIGAGESGVCLAAKLQYKLGFDQFRVFDRRSCLGGTWFANSYPGIACDIPAVCYSFSFAQNAAWTAPYPSGTEIVQYLYDVASEHRVLDKIQCDTNVKSMRWLDAEQQWELILEYLAPGVGDMSSAERTKHEEQSKASTVLREETVRARIVVSAVGGLVEPKDPLDLPGKEDFQGAIMHTARWDHSVDIKDKNIVVIGTGCSAAQVIPKLIESPYEAKHVTQLMRTPPWTTPFLPKEVQAKWREWMPRLSTNIPGFQKFMRKLMFTMIELEWFQLFAANDAAYKRRQHKRKELLDYMHKTAPKEYHDILTPDYDVFCKRRVIDDGWFECLNDSRIELSTKEPKALKRNGLVLGEGQVYPKDSKADSPEKEIPCDVLVMANGYRTNEWLHPLKVTGKNGISLHDQWQREGGAGAYLTVACHNFPNYFMLVGPNSVTGHSSVILASENASNYAINFIEPILRGDVSTYEIKQSAEHQWTEDTQKTLNKSVYNIGGATNWYVKDGWNSTMYPRSQVDFWLRCQLPRWRHWNASYTNKGLLKLWASRFLWVATLVIGWRVGAKAWPHIRARGVRGLVEDVGTRLWIIINTISAEGIKVLK